MHFTTETSSNGVVEHTFTVRDITGVLWSSAAGSERAPLVLLGHGGGQHKKAPGNVARARQFVTDHGFAVAAIDAPGHGDRPRTAADEQHVAAVRQAQSSGEPLLPIVIGYNTSVAERAVPEWRATLDALQELPEIGPAGPVFYWGVAMGTAIGVPLTAVEPRIKAAAFGMLGHESLMDAAAKITVPVHFLLEWEGGHVPRQSGLALFEAFATKDKTLHAYPGAHLQRIPAYELESAARFFVRHI